jgi:2-C-methyl-D-erythritol 2,4-cyclodiphosphate synthase
MEPKLKFRTGFGYDVHAFAQNRKLIIGGVEIPFDRGLLGHSDADVLLHAIADALLGSLALGDIGKHFPDNDPAYKNADSLKLLSHVYSLVEEKGYILANVDATVALQKPKLAPFIDKMRANIAGVLKSGADQVSVKATTTEKLGFVGNQEGAAAYATVLIIDKEY